MYGCAFVACLDVLVCVCCVISATVVVAAAVVVVFVFLCDWPPVCLAAISYEKWEALLGIRLLGTTFWWGSYRRVATPLRRTSPFSECGP